PPGILPRTRRSFPGVDGIRAIRRGSATLPRRRLTCPGIRRSSWLFSFVHGFFGAFASRQLLPEQRVSSRARFGATAARHLKAFGHFLARQPFIKPQQDHLAMGFG